MSGDTVRVRVADPAQFPALGALTATAYADGSHLSEDDDYLRQLADPASRTGGCDLLVATDGVAVVGGVSLVHPGSPLQEVAGPGEAEVRMLAVDPGLQRRGIAARLVTECLDRSRRAGYEAVALCVIRDNEGAHRLYRRFGFVRTPDRDWSSRRGVDLLAYRLELGAAAAG